MSTYVLYIYMSSIRVCPMFLPTNPNCTLKFLKRMGPWDTGAGSNPKSAGLKFWKSRRKPTANTCGEILWFYICRRKSCKSTPV